MRAIIIYDSYFGNTEKIARVLGEELEAKVARVNDIKKSDLADVEIMIIGSPIRGWKPSDRMEKFLGEFGDHDLLGKKVAAYDTRVKLFIHGDAASKISRVAERAGANIIVEPEAFFVKGSEGPLFDGEIERAREWGKKIKEKI
jgi:flavodoxin